ncbi:MAG: 50S ribosomal protein L27 [Legionellales bacterium]|nr:50S ribosomal protein L27 [Legionellales bacterium]
MAHKKAGGSTNNGRDSNPRYDGVKCYGGEHVEAGSIIVRQVGSRFHAGKGSGMGRDFTVYAKVTGTVHFTTKGRLKKKTIMIIPSDQQAV